MLKEEVFVKKILTWFEQCGRHDLPWQKNINAYRVWLSEIMLQQTQVTTVIPYFLKFLKRFPTLKSLASSSIDDVLPLWAGLGYYARARNLHKCATLVYEKHAGAFPQTLEELIALPGIGRSTAGAILSIAYQIPTPILDGNVKRVLSRYTATAGWAGDKKTSDVLWEYATQYTPTTRVEDYTQAIMDLGATLCTRSSPNCTLCPLQKTCTAHLAGNETTYPGKKPKKQIPIKTKYFWLIQNTIGDVLLYKRPMTGIWGGLWSLPESEYKNDPIAHFDFKPMKFKKLTSFRHTFSHYHLDIHPLSCQTRKQNPVEILNGVWYKPSEILDLGLSAPVKKLLQEIIL